ncbi:MAG: hypothetical protein ABIJ56_13155 [Pseudomonadota bacterium]
MKKTIKETMTAKRAITAFSNILMAAAVLVSAAYCSPAYLPAYETAKQPDIKEKKLVIRKMMSEADFIAALKQRSATNIVASHGYINGNIVSAVTADNMEYIYLFNAGHYTGRLEIRHDEGAAPLHPFIKVVYGKNKFGVFLTAENLRLNGRRVAQLILVRKGSEPVYVSIELKSMIENNNGMIDPYVGGENLDTGIFLSARDNEGRVWNVIYLISFPTSKSKVEAKPIHDAYCCPMFVSWMDGKGAREIFSMRTD